MRRPNTGGLPCKTAARRGGARVYSPGGLRLRAADVSRRSCRRGNRARLIRRGTYGCCLPNNRRRHYRLFRSDSE